MQFGNLILTCLSNLYFPSSSKPIRFIEKSRPGTQMVCSSFSPGKGTFLPCTCRQLYGVLELCIYLQSLRIIDKTIFLRNRKHLPCFCVSKTLVQVWEKSEMLREYKPTGECLHSFFNFSRTTMTSYNSVEIRRTCFLFVLENSAVKKRKA